jgi:hypothetical protein
MLSAKEISDYVRGQARSPEKQQFTFSGDALTTHWHAITDMSDDESRLTDIIALATTTNKAKVVKSRSRRGGPGETHSARRNILLILLFIAVFAVMFVLDARQAPASPVSGHAESTSTVAP